MTKNYCFFYGEESLTFSPQMRQQCGQNKDHRSPDKVVSICLWTIDIDIDLGIHEFNKEQS